MQAVGAGDRGVFPYDRGDVALAGIEGHLLVLLSFLKLLQVFLKDIALM